MFLIDTANFKHLKNETLKKFLWGNFSAWARLTEILIMLV